jgi:hypothetical protein
MKQSLFVLMCAFIFSIGMAQEPAGNNLLAKLKWDKMEHDFGQIRKSVPVNFEFQFTNKTNQPVLITNIQSSCGCTTTNYPKEPIAPNKTAKISATYNAANVGAFTKTLTVTTTAESTPVVLKITGTVYEK